MAVENPGAAQELNGNGKHLYKYACESISYFALLLLRYYKVRLRTAINEVFPEEVCYVFCFFCYLDYSAAPPMRPHSSTTARIHADASTRG